MIMVLISTIKPIKTVISIGYSYQGYHGIRAEPIKLMCIVIYNKKAKLTLDFYLKMCYNILYSDNKH